MKRGAAGPFPCPCCGHLGYSAPPGSFEICESCWWEDDVVQLRWPEWPGGANKPSLLQAQATASAIGVSDARFSRQAHVIVLPNRDPAWRPLSPGLDPFESLNDRSTPWPPDPTHLYWWRKTYWRTQPSPSLRR